MEYSITLNLGNVRFEGAQWFEINHKGGFLVQQHW